MPDEGTGEVPVETPSQEATPQVQTPTAEEQLKTLQAQLDEAKAAQTKYEESYKGLQRTLNKTNEELKRQADLRAEFDGLKETQKILAAMLAEREVVAEGNPENIPQGKRQDLLKQYEDIERKQAEKRKQLEQEARAREYSTQADEVYAQAKSLNMPEEELWKIEDSLSIGKLDRAKHYIAKFQPKSKETTVPKPEQSDEIPEEKIREYMVKKGLLKTDTVVAGGKGRSKADILKAYAEGDRSLEEEAAKLLGFQ